MKKFNAEVLQDFLLKFGQAVLDKQPPEELTTDAIYRDYSSVLPARMSKEFALKSSTEGQSYLVDCLDLLSDIEAVMPFKLSSGKFCRVLVSRYGHTSPSDDSLPIPLAIYTLGEVEDNKLRCYVEKINKLTPNGYTGTIVVDGEEIEVSLMFVGFDMQEDLPFDLTGPAIYRNFKFFDWSKYQ